MWSWSISVLQWRSGGQFGTSLCTWRRSCHSHSRPTPNTTKAIIASGTALSLALGHAGAFLSHRAFHNQYQKRDHKRQHGDHPKAVEVGKRGCLLLPQIFEFLQTQLLRGN